MPDPRPAERTWPAQPSLELDDEFVRLQRRVDDLEATVGQAIRILEAAGLLEVVFPSGALLYMPSGGRRRRGRRR